MMSVSSDPLASATAGAKGNSSLAFEARFGKRCFGKVSVKPQLRLRMFEIIAPTAMTTGGMIIPATIDLVLASPAGLFLIDLKTAARRRNGSIATRVWLSPLLGRVSLYFSHQFAGMYEIVGIK